jgi:hypothetical protein
MNKIITTLLFMIVLALLSPGVVFADTICLNDPLSCNDILLIYTETENPTILDVIGYEYGCNKPYRLIRGVGRIVGNIAYVNYRMADEEFFGGVFGSPPGDFTTDNTFILVYDLSANSGTYKYYSTNGFPSTTAGGTYELGICPAETATTVIPDGPDKLAEFENIFE